MPEICRFLGIVISMYFDEHNPPHFHIRYNDYRAVRVDAIYRSVHFQNRQLLFISSLIFCAVLLDHNKALG